MEADSRIDLFNHTPVFEGLELKQIQLLISACEEVQRPAGTQLFTEGDDSDQLWLVEVGSVEIHKAVNGQIERTLATFGPGQVFGELEFMDGGKRSAGARTTVNSTFLILTHDKLDELARQNAMTVAAFNRNVCKTLAQRLRSTNELYRMSVSDNFEAIGADVLSLHNLASGDTPLKVQLRSGTAMDARLIQVNEHPSGWHLVFRSLETGELTVVPYHAIDAIGLGKPSSN